MKRFVGITDRYGMRTADFVAMQLEYPSRSITSKGAPDTHGPLERFPVPHGDVFSPQRTQRTQR